MTNEATTTTVRKVILGNAGHLVAYVDVPASTRSVYVAFGGVTEDGCGINIQRRKVSRARRKLAEAELCFLPVLEMSDCGSFFIVKGD